VSLDPVSVRPVVVTGNYPTPDQPNWGTFVESLVRQWTRTGSEVCVIAPFAYQSAQAGRLVLRYPESSGPGEPTVVRPGFFTFSNRTLGPLRTAHWTHASFRRSVIRASARLPWKPHLTYSHFLLPAGYAGLALARRLGVPAVAALGESGFTLYEDTTDIERIRRTARGFDAVLSVSRFNRDWVVEHYGVEPDRVVVIPNATDTDRFRPGDRAALRRELGLPEDRVLLAFSGRFAERKGPLRVLEAIRDLPEVSGIFLGDGPDHPKGPQVAVARKVSHDQVPRYLGAADLYVLPTLEEGSPNSVIEAMACGLPIVSSDLPSLRETVTAECALLVDPMDTEALAAAIRDLVREPERRRAMGRAARAVAETSSLARRADRIRDWLAGVVERGPRGAG